MGTLGVTSLLLTLAGYWAGRYGETTGRGRIQAPLVATVGATVLVELGGYGLHVLLGESISAEPPARRSAGHRRLQRPARLPGLCVGPADRRHNGPDGARP